MLNIHDFQWTREPAAFIHMALTECKWLPHDGQQPDEV